MLNSSQSMVARYRYDPFGNTISTSGSLATANTYRFSSKEIHVNSGMYYYGYRFYDPNLQRWSNRDPINENGGLNLYRFAANDPLSQADTDGLSLKDIGKGIAGDGKLCTAANCNKIKCKDKAKRLPEEGWDPKDKNSWKDIPDPGKCLDADGVATEKGVLKIPNGVTCTIRCDKEGNPKDISCRKRWLVGPGPEMNPPYFPPTPFPK